MPLARRSVIGFIRVDEKRLEYRQALKPLDEANISLFPPLASSLPLWVHPLPPPLLLYMYSWTVPTIDGLSFHLLHSTFVFLFAFRTCPEGAELRVPARQTTPTMVYEIGQRVVFYDRATLSPPVSR